MEKSYSRVNLAREVVKRGREREKLTMMLMDKLSPNVNTIPKRKHQISRRVASSTLL